MSAVALSLEGFAQTHARLWLVRQPAPELSPVRWSFTALAGRLVEISSEEGSAALSVSLRLVAGAHREADLAVWVGAPESSFYPPDVVTHGIDLEQFPIVRVPKAEQVALAGARLGRSGAFGLIVLDLEGVSRLTDAHLGRLAQQAQRHAALVLCLTRKAAHTPSLGSLVSLRAAVRRERVDTDRFRCTVKVLKDKRSGAGWEHEEILHGVPGLH